MRERISMASILEEREVRTQYGDQRQSAVGELLDDAGNRVGPLDEELVGLSNGRSDGAGEAGSGNAEERENGVEDLGGEEHLE